MKQKKGALGRGLGAILESPETDITSRDISGKFVVGAIAEIEINKIETNPFQPRTEFEEQALKDLAESIEKQGLIQPVTVRKSGFEKFQLISGERRLRASKIIGLEKIPAYIRIADDEQMLEMALIENVHREDLNAIEVALSYQRLQDECNLTLQQMSEKLSQNRSTINNYIRLLKLPAEVQVAVRDNQISMAHARNIVALEDIEDQLSLLKDIIEKDLSVRATEQLVKSMKELTKPQNPVKGAKHSSDLPEKYVGMRDNIARHLSADVAMNRNRRGRGQIVIKFKSDDELQRIIDLINAGVAESE